MLAGSLVALASLAGNTIVAAATTDAWEAARRGFVRLLGRGDPDRAKAAERRLTETREQLTGAAAAELEPTRSALEAQWVTRMADLLEEDPGLEADMRALVDEIRAALPGGVVSAAGHSVAAGRDVNITASGGGVAAGVIHGNVAPPDPPGPDPGDQLAGSGRAVDLVPGSVFADRGGVAIGLAYQRAGVVGKPVRLAARPDRLAGREDLLEEMDIRLTGDKRSGPRMVVLCGLGGAGKTSVAVEYAHCHLAEVGVAWQLIAEDPTVLAAGFEELAAQLGAQDVLVKRDPVASVHGVLAAFPAGWLLVFDNAEDRASVQAFLPPAGEGRVVITSQSPLWPPGQALDVLVLGAEIAADFLVNRTGDPDPQAARELAGELGGLPLALEQAAAYMQATGDSLADYLTSFRQRRPTMLRRGEPIAYRGTVATTWALAFARLEQSAPSAAGLLRLLACCAPEAIPLRLLLQPRPGLAGQLSPAVAVALMPLLEDPLVVKDAIAALRRYSLISPPADGSVSVHRLVQAVTLDQLPAELAQAWRHAAAAVIEAAIPGDPNLPETWPVFAALLPHGRAGLAEDSDGMARIASYLGWSGSYAAAEDLQRRVLDARERVLGPEHPDTLTARHELAYWTREAGDLAAARDLLAELLPVCERVLGPEHPRTLAIRGNLGRWTGQAGDPAGARDLFADLLLVRERVLGPEHPHTLITRHCLARWTGEAGDAAGARDLSAALLPVVERVLGPEHPDTLITRHNLGRWTGEAGDAAAASDLFAALLPVYERVLGPDHPDTLSDRGNLARWMGEAGDAAGARDLFAALLPVCERVLGPEHPDTQAARIGLTRWTGDTGGNARFGMD